MDVIINKKLRRKVKEVEIIWKESHNRFQDFSLWDEKINNSVTVNYKISIITTVMNRLHDIKQTLIKNITDNISYSNLEFVILDYNSSDGLEEWVKNNLKEYINSGVVNYYRTTEPKYFSMAHSRNIAYKVADGVIINNVDADSYTDKGFVEYINLMANQTKLNKVIFAKSRQLLRGRIGFYKEAFFSLGGYNEEFNGYGHDDADIMHRALYLGFMLMCYRKFSGCVSDHQKHQEGNYKYPWWETEVQNRLLSYANLFSGKFVANKDREWGKAKLIKNFNEEVIT